MKKSYDQMSWKEKKLDYLEYRFGPYVPEYSEHHDDRIVYRNIYNQIKTALESLPDEPDLYVKVALDNAIREDQNVMKRILNHFEHVSPDHEMLYNGKKIGGVV